MTIHSYQNHEAYLPNLPDKNFNLSLEAANQRIDELENTAKQIIRLNTPNNELLTKIDDVSKEGKSQIKEFYDDLNKNIDEIIKNQKKLNTDFDKKYNDPIYKKQIKKNQKLLKKEYKILQDGIKDIYNKTQKDLSKVITQSYINEALNSEDPQIDKVILAKILNNSLEGKLLKLSNKIDRFCEIGGNKIRNRFSKKKMKLSDRNSNKIDIAINFIKNPKISKIEIVEALPIAIKEALEEQDEQLARTGVVRIEGQTVIKPVFTGKKAEKQMKSYIAQVANEKVREKIVSKITISPATKPGEENTIVEYESTLIPLNKEFDRYVSQDGKVGFFESIVGDKGLGSAHTEVNHLKNGFLNIFSGHIGGELKEVNQVLRHGVIARQHEKNLAKRKEAAEYMAKELATAAVLEGIRASGKKLEDVKEWNQTLVSISLVTPDLLYGLLHKHASEQEMLRSQEKAFQDLEKNGLLIEIDGHQIQVNLDIIRVNTGVNAGAKIGGGRSEQWKMNKVQIPKFLALSRELMISAELMMESDRKIQPEQEKITSLKQDIRNLHNDITYLSQSKHAYFRKNPYELAAKIEILANRLGELHSVLKTLSEQGNIRESNKAALSKFDGIIPAINCKSAKDRTGVAVAVAYTYEAMKLQLGKYPTHEELEKPEMQEKFLEIYFPLLLQYGGTKVAELSTNTSGYKISKEAMFFPDAAFWKQFPFYAQAIKGAAITTGS